MSKSKEEDIFKLTTPKFRGSYVNLAKPRAVKEGDDPQYGITIVLPKDDPFWEKVEKLIPKAAKKKFGKVPKKLVTTRQDGDDEDQPEEWKGCYAIPAQLKASRGKPGIIDTSGEEIIDPSELYSGAWYQATVKVGAWQFGGMRKGVSLFLNNVMKVKDDETFSGRASARDDFANEIDKHDSGEGGDDGEDDRDDPLS